MSKGLDDATFGVPTGEFERRYGVPMKKSPQIVVTEPALVPAAGIKHDVNKAAMHLIPSEAIEAMAQVLEFGARKYEPRNWERGLLYSRVFAAAMRHLWAWWRGEDRDTETNFSHLDHALTCVAFLVSYERRGMQSFDDRARNTTP